MLAPGAAVGDSDRMLPAWVDRALYPFEPRRLETSAGALSVVDVGAGPALVFVHGTPSWSFEWRHLIADLARDHRCVAVDLLGFGLSDKPATFSHRPQDHAALLGEALDALGVEQATLLVHDFGGPIGLGAALAQPARVRAVVVFNTWLWATADHPTFPRVSRLVASPLGRLLHRGANASPRWIVPRSFGRKGALTKPVRAHYLAPFPTWADRLAPWRFGVELLASSDWYQSLWERRAALADKPALLVWGMADVAFQRPELDRFRSLWPRAQVVELANVGHFPQEEAPDEVLAAVRPFLRAVEA